MSTLGTIAASLERAAEGAIEAIVSYRGRANADGRRRIAASHVDRGVAAVSAEGPAAASSADGSSAMSLRKFVFASFLASMAIVGQMPPTMANCPVPKLSTFEVEYITL